VAPVSKSRNRAARQDSRRSDLLDAAAKLFRERGYHDTSMRDVAGAAGMLAGSIYYHFESKEDMLLAVYETAMRRAAEAVDEAMARETDPWKRLVAACSAHLEAMLSQTDYVQVMIRVLPRDGGKVAARMITLRDGYEAKFKRAIEELDLPANINRGMLRLMLLGALNWSQVWYRPGRDSPEVIAGHFLDILRRQLDVEPRRNS
jgi:TetR/AcrR family transcriptional regulator, cholesterol catabolism regulator